MTATIPPPSDNDDFADRARQACARLTGEAHPLLDCRRLTGGASMETWTLQYGDEHLILRRIPGGGDFKTIASGIELEDESALIRIMGQHGVKVPHICGNLIARDALGAGYIMAAVPGEALPPRLFRDPGLARVLDALPDTLAGELARIHAVPVAALPETIPRLGGSDLIKAYERSYRANGEVRPIFELAFAWLEERCDILEAGPQPEPVLVHGDFRMGNLMIDASGLTAVLDWELAHLGDRHQDLAYLCAPSWRFGRYERVVGGVGDIDPFLAAYQAESGTPIDHERFAFWRMLTTVFWGAACMDMLGGWRSGSERSLERAAIGRRISEVEIDILLLLEELEGRPDGLVDWPETPAVPQARGPTTLEEIITALSDWNEADVMRAASGRDLFQSRVARTLFGTLARERAMGRGFAVAQARRLKTRDLTTETLGQALRRGALRYADVANLLRPAAVERLLIDQPTYAGLAQAKKHWTPPQSSPEP